MKQFRICLAAIAAPLALVQAATTTPVGFTTLAVDPGLNIIGLNLVEPVEFQGAVTGSGTDTITVAGEDLSIYGNGLHFVEIASGPDGIIGFNAPIASANGDTITLGIDGQIPGDLTGETLKIREHWTIGKVFGENNEAGLTAGGTIEEADKVIIRDSSGAFRRFYFQNASEFFGGTGWREAGNSEADASDTILYFTDGIIVDANQSGSFKLVGAVKEGPTQIVLLAGTSILTNLAPVDSETLGNSGLATSLTGSDTIENADKVILRNPDGSFTRYFFQEASEFFGGTGWRSAGNSSADASAVQLPLDRGYLISTLGDRTVTLTPSF